MFTSRFLRAMQDVTLTWKKEEEEEETVAINNKMDNWVYKNRKSKTLGLGKLCKETDRVMINDSKNNVSMFLRAFYKNCTPKFLREKTY